MRGAASITVQTFPDGEPGSNPWIDISNDFTNQMFSLLHISETLLPKTKVTPEEYIESRIKKIADLLSPEERKELSNALGWLLASMRKSPAFPMGEGLTAEPPNSQRGEHLTPAADETPKEDESDKDNKGKEISITSSNVSAAMIQFMHDMATGGMSGNHATLRRSLLVTAVSNFEILFGKLAQEIYAVNKSALNDSEYSFSLQELAQFDSLEDAREFLAERRVSALMRDSVDGWDKWLGKAVKGASMADTPVNWPVTREVFARRNLLVHNGGIVNQIYLSIASRLDEKGKPNVEIGDNLKVDAEYFSTAVQNLLALGVIVLTDVACRLSKTSTRTLHDALLFNADMAVNRGAWHASLAISKYLLSCRLRRADQLNAQILNWVTRKRIKGVDDIRSEVEDWDISGLAEEISHYKVVLLGDKKQAVEKIEELITGKKLGLVEVALHPAYEELIEDLPSISRMAKASQSEVTEVEKQKLPAKKSAAKKTAPKRQPAKKTAAKKAVRRPRTA
ncbi:hypothetical protein [Streptomyces sp. CAI-155]|uniref:hypothetical protein n=1 Tax=Streptomyces sp. CAI-155 TaxID=1472660 RepID=UPI00158774C7|nr:hypothetical protein [Streptomyces sp. CAI-155]NUV80290.1 hypothetical protein [Streptomyces sp. CAI-155]